ncbi:FAD/NAD(P)-binding protein [bacterium]|nr:FAD/NAD(P)-binding protein [bacterium]
MNDFVKFEMGFLPVEAKITKIIQTTAYEKIFTLKLPENKRLKYLPCQFVMVSVFGFGEAPISICSGPDDQELELCVRRVGTLTTKLHKLQVGDSFGIRGPYGNGFPTEVLQGKDLLFVAGGLGLAPLRSLIRYVFKHRENFGRFTLLYGAKKTQDRLFVDEIELWENSNEVDFYQTVDVSDEKWEGNVGLITSLFKFVEPKPEKTIGVIVGPPVMYKFVIREMLKKQIPVPQIFMSLERRMRCGLGKCGHCQMNGIYVCQEGPVFNYNEVKDLKEAL